MFFGYAVEDVLSMDYIPAIGKAGKYISLTDSQTEMRRAFLGGFAGQLVSGLIWLAASAIST